VAAATRGCSSAPTRAGSQERASCPASRTSPPTWMRSGTSRTTSSRRATPKRSSCSARNWRNRAHFVRRTAYLVLSAESSPNTRYPGTGYGAKPLGPDLHRGAQRHQLVEPQRHVVGDAHTAKGGCAPDRVGPVGPVDANDPVAP